MKHYTVFFILLVLAIVCAAVWAISSGAAPIYAPDIFFGKLTPGEESIILNIRLPRIILALTIGASLGAGGTVFQSLLRNPLADPYIIGVSGGAALGAALAIVTGLPQSAVAVCAAAGALTTAGCVHLLAFRFGFSSVSLILSGVALSFIFSSGVMLVFVFGRSQDVHKALMWLMGDLSSARHELAAVLIPVSFVCIIILFLLSRGLDVVSLGHTVSKNLGVGRIFYAAVYWLAALLAGISVTLGGVIGFIGLVAPHVMRGITGPGHRTLIPAAALGGALFLLVCDTAGRTAAAPYELPAGIITGFAGGIFFLYFMLRKNRQ